MKKRYIVDIEFEIPEFKVVASTTAEAREKVYGKLRKLPAFKLLIKNRTNIREF